MCLSQKVSPRRRSIVRGTFSALASLVVLPAALVAQEVGSPGDAISPPKLPAATEMIEPLDRGSEIRANVEMWEERVNRKLQKLNEKLKQLDLTKIDAQKMARDEFETILQDFDSEAGTIIGAGLPAGCSWKPVDATDEFQRSREEYLLDREGNRPRLCLLVDAGVGKTTAMQQACYLRNLDARPGHLAMGFRFSELPTKGSEYLDLGAESFLAESFCEGGRDADLSGRGGRVPATADPGRKTVGAGRRSRPKRGGPIRPPPRPGAGGLSEAVS